MLLDVGCLASLDRAGVARAHAALCGIQRAAHARRGTLLKLLHDDKAHAHIVVKQRSSSGQVVVK